MKNSLKQTISEYRYLSFGAGEKRKLNQEPGSLRYKKIKNLEKIEKINMKIDFYIDKIHTQIMSKIQSPGHFKSLKQNKIDDLNRELQLINSLGDIIMTPLLTEFANYLQNIYATNGYAGFKEDSAYNYYLKYINIFDPLLGINLGQRRGYIIRYILADRFTHETI